MDRVRIENGYLFKLDGLGFADGRGQICPFLEVDTVRGLAVTMMVLYHLLFDLDYFGVRDFEVHSGFWLGFARLTASLFILLVGVSIMLSYFRAERLGQVEQFPFRLVKRGIWIFSLGLGITMFTYMLIGRGFVVFGVLHLIGVSMLLAYPFLRLRAMNAILGLLFISIGLYLQHISFDFAWLLWLGLTPRDFYSLDYFPLLPWFGVVMLGMALGDHFYRGYSRRIPLPDLSLSPLVKPLALLGRNSLLVYIIHQPILIAFLFFAGVTLLWL